MEAPIEKDRWKNRRAMAWWAFYAGLLFPALFFFVEKDTLEPLIWPFYTFVGAVVGAYIGFATYVDKWQKP
ncbi:MAG: hypothetical protein WCR98_06765 [Saccharofermentanales bacterium]